MSELLSYYKLCPVSSDILGLAEDADESSVVCTLGKKIVYVMQVCVEIKLLRFSF